MTASESPQPMALEPTGKPVDQLRPLSRDSQYVDGPPALAVHALAINTSSGPRAIPGSLYDVEACVGTGSVLTRHP
jgi:hypothetical protein